MPSRDEQHVYTAPGRLDRPFVGTGRIVAASAIGSTQSIADHRYTTVIVREIPRPVVSDATDATPW